MQIVITNNGDKDCEDVGVRIYPHGCSHGITLAWSCDTVVERFALEKLLREDLQDTIRAAVKKAYMEGWSDHRRKVHKKTCFANHFNTVFTDGMRLSY